MAAIAKGMSAGERGLPEDQAAIQSQIEELEIINGSVSGRR